MLALTEATQMRASVSVGSVSSEVEFCARPPFPLAGLELTVENRPDGVVTCKVLTVADILV